MHDCPVFMSDTIPDKQLQRLLLLRAYDEKHMMVDSEVVEGNQLEGFSKAMLADEKVRYINVHNAEPGCFAFKIERA
ncbi:uncharacterized protein A1O9_11287 [Exophiala aquamarina CBS 119918]|uniref:DUF1203 domain-containing protein n=1 Tax=Exophiala aquamarina CBS 119918 TaxID=1182545 RepID=A0A072NYD4_9EURO|nr:uncharacterized protein A1O9_11287 [Exophiala aquamarina CBS 119918]KEF52869.1 hypothetical protein A1O9_11287 [Exophiala aquamarina CBS 119918]